MRLFVYVPTSKNYNGMIAAVSLRDVRGADIGTWNFPLEPTPPGLRSVASLWQLDKPYADSSPGFAPLLSQGTWVRSEFPTLFDPALYNTGAEVRLNVQIRGIDETTIKGTLNGVITASGSSAPAEAAADYVAVARNILISAGRQDWGGLGRRVLSLMADPVEPSRITLSGSMMGPLTAVSLTRRADSDLWVRLSGTYTPISDQEKFRAHGGWGGFQRCLTSRVGAIGFEAAALTAPPGAARDPRPAMIPVNLNYCGTANYPGGAATVGTPSAQCGSTARSGAGTAQLPAMQYNIVHLRKAPWSGISIQDEKVVIERYTDMGSLVPDPDGEGPQLARWIPPSATPLWQRELSIDSQGNITIPPVTIGIHEYQRSFFMLRWKAKITAPGMRPFAFTYALELDSKLRVVNPDGCRWVDVDEYTNSSPPRLVTHRECQ
jgi:hypothetical protein